MGRLFVAPFLVGRDLMELFKFMPPYYFGPVQAIQAPRQLDRTMASIARDPVASKHMRITEADYAVRKVVEEANEFHDAYFSRRGLREHDTERAMEEAGDLAMSLQMATRNMGYGRWALAGYMRQSVTRMGRRWPKAKAAWQQLKDWPSAWAQVKNAEVV